MSPKLKELAESPLLRLLVPLATGIAIPLLCNKVQLVPKGWLLSGLSLIALAILIVHLIGERSRFRSWTPLVFQILAFIGIGVCGWVWCCLKLRQATYPWPSQPISIQGCIEETPSPKPKTLACTIHWKDTRLIAYLPKDKKSQNLKVGDWIQIQAQISQPANFSSFNYVRYLQCRGITGQTFVRKGQWKTIPAQQTGLVNRLKIKAEKTRHGLYEKLCSPDLEEEDIHLIAAMLLGYKSQIDSETRAAYSSAGVAHILALSGLHVGLIVLILGWLLPARMPYRKGILSVGLWLYIFIVGLPVSAIRAGCMMTIALIRPAQGEQHLSLDAWALSAIILLLWQPLYLADVGFQLSFAAVGSILFCHPFIPYIGHRLHKCQKWFWVCLTAQMGVMPLSIAYFGVIPIYFLLSNLLVTTLLVPTILYLSILLLLLSTYFPEGANWITPLLHTCIQGMQWVVNWIQTLPGAHLQI